MKNHFFIFFGLLYFFSLKSFDYDTERIISFKSTINVQKDASIIVQEEIEVLALGYKIKKGIFRDFPTIYFDHLKNKYIVDFEVLDVIRDNQNENYFIENLSNGKRIYIGNRNNRLEPGIYNFLVKYKTNRQIGFFKNWDELYWNVTGNGWNFEIDNVTAIVNLPKEISLDKIDFDFYTGHLDSKEKNAIANKIDNQIVFQTTKALKPFQGFTIDVIWPKGFIKEPSLLQKIYFLLKDNIILILLFFSFCLLTFYYLFIYFKVRNPLTKVIIPLFEPPQSLTAGEIRFINKTKYDDKVLTSEILDMAVKGYLKIDYNQKFYTLIKNNEPEKDSPHYAVWLRLFQYQNELPLIKSNATILKRAIEILKSELYYKFEKKYFVNNQKYLTLGHIILIISAIAAFTQNPIYGVSTLIIFTIINLIFTHLLKQYTNEGNRLKAEILGFKMFLSASEKERINFFAAPDRTPENYENLLPYAIAFDVEKKWTAQFKKVFEELKEKNLEYHPSWYLARRYDHFDYSDVANISSGINNALNNVIISSGRPPGSSSGFGGRGSSGRGGGGGGGGGW